MAGLVLLSTCCFLFTACVNSDTTVRVFSDGGGDFSSLQAALNSTSGRPSLGRVTLVLRGTFRERVLVQNFSLGLDIVPLPGAARPLIIYNVSGAGGSGCSGAGGPGTFGSYTMQLLSSDIRVRGVDIANSACGYNHKVAGQSVALDVRGDRAAFFDVRLWGSQDTLYTGAQRSYFADAFVNGSCDAIFGEGSAVFERAEIRMNFTVTAQKGNGSTAYLFLNSTVDTLEGGGGTLVLGRPWGSLARTVFSGCYLGPGIAKVGWDDWHHSCGNTGWCNATFYAGFNNSGPGYAPSAWPNWTHVLSPSEGALWTVERVLGDWRPSPPP